VRWLWAVVSATVDVDDHGAHSRGWDPVDASCSDRENAIGTKGRPRGAAWFGLSGAGVAEPVGGEWVVGLGGGWSHVGVGIGRGQVGRGCSDRSGDRDSHRTRSFCRCGDVAGGGRAGADDCSWHGAEVHGCGPGQSRSTDRHRCPASGRAGRWRYRGDYGLWNFPDDRIAHAVYGDAQGDRRAGDTLDVVGAVVVRLSPRAGSTGRIGGARN
jgi:hypothetical protein